MKALVIMMETIKQHVPYTHALGVMIESKLLREGYHLENVSVTSDHIIDTYINDAGNRLVLGKDNTTGYLIAEDQS